MTARFAIGLTDVEIKQAVALGDQHKADFYAAGKSITDHAADLGIADHVAMATVSMEGLAIAAFMHVGTAESFVEMARRAINIARELQQDGGQTQ
jgi:hypothetical protein